MTNYREEHIRLRKITGAADQRCMGMQNDLSGLKDHLLEIGRGNGVPPGCLIEINDAAQALQKAEWLLIYVRHELNNAKQCFGMRDEHGEVE